MTSLFEKKYSGHIILWHCGDQKGDVHIWMSWHDLSEGIKIGYLLGSPKILRTYVFRSFNPTKYGKF